MKIAYICNHTFVEDYLSDTSCVVDCGVNYGHFSSEVSRKWKCMIHGFEPDPRLFPNLPKLEKCKFHQVALAEKKGTMRLNLGDGQCSSLYYKENDESDSVEIETVSLPEFCAENGIDKIDLLKLDIEGAEIGVIDHLTDEWLTSRVVQLTVEFHEFLDPQVVPDIKNLIERLKRLGFYYLPFSLTYGDVLFVNRHFVTISAFGKLTLVMAKYARGGLRLLARLLGKTPD